MARLKNPKAKGSRNERKVRDIYRKNGYFVVKAGGSLGMFDLVALAHTDAALIQVKTNEMPSKAEMDRLKAFEAPKYAMKVLHVVYDAKHSITRKPRIGVVLL